ncbi:hypothetical protein MMB232_00727 [Brevundimonas subvibrioides]|uniref:FtsK/SpoIIIE domain-containing protein n=1 Tax=Brevundimonas subvibrioides TaxID=74313 RepID=UPI0032D57544
MDRLHFNQAEKDLFDRIIVEGLGQKTGWMWWPVRIAIARSLQLNDIPAERFKAPPARDRASELHLTQVTGLGQRPDGIGQGPVDPDYDDAFKLLLAVKHDEDLFSDPDRYTELLQRHARRGLEIIATSWSPGKSFHDWLLEELFVSTEVITDGAMDQSAFVINWGLLERGFSQIAVSAQLIGEPIEGPRLSRFHLTLDGVEDYDRLRRGLDDLAFTIGLSSGGLTMSREGGERRVVLDVPRPSVTWLNVNWQKLRDGLGDAPTGLPVSPGVDVLGAPFLFDLAEAPHLFVAGATGSGKSVCLNALLLSLLAAKEAPEIMIIDPKGVDFSDYEGCVRLRDRKVITDMEEGVTVLRKLVGEMDSRQTELRDFGARNIADARAAGSTMKRLVVVIDELADFLMGKNSAQEPLTRLAQKARAVGIHLVLATQRPEAATFPGLLRANIPSRIALTVQKAVDSRIILDMAGAEALLMRGDMLVKLVGRDPQRVHGAQVTSQDVRTAVALVNAQ